MFRLAEAASVCTPPSTKAWWLIWALFLTMGLTPYHYWDEYFYLYSVYLNEPLTLFKIEPDLGGFFPAGFFTAKAGLIYTLDFLVDNLGDGYQSLRVLNILFFGQTIIFILACWYLFKLLLPDTLRFFVLICLIFSPLNLYFGGKLLSEVPSLMWLSLAYLFLMKALCAHNKSRLVLWATLTSIAVALACWYRLTTALGMIAFVATLLIYKPHKLSIKSIIVYSALIGTASLGLLFVLSAISGLNPLASVSGLSNNLAGRSHSILLAIYAIGLFGQGFYLLFTLGLLQRWGRMHLMAVVWLALTSAPFIFSSSYLEPRFFYLALIPFSIVCGLGVQQLQRWLASRNYSPLVLLASLAMLALFNRFVLLPNMPHEHNQSRLHHFIASLPNQEDQIDFYPWLSDFSFARFAFPERNAVLTMNWTYNDQNNFFDTQALKKWVGEDHLLSKKPATPVNANYIGWEVSPVIVRLQSWLNAVGIAINLQEGQKNHLKLGWPWSEISHTSPQLDDGHYKAYRYPPLN